MKHTESEILNALHIIQETCHESNCEENCPFSCGDECIIANGPDDWRINDSEVPVWKGLL